MTKVSKQFGFPAHPLVLHSAMLAGPQRGKVRAGVQHHPLRHCAVSVVPVALVMFKIICDETIDYDKPNCYKLTNYLSGEGASNLNLPTI